MGRVAGQRQFQSRLISAAQASSVRVLHTLIHVDPSAPGYRLSGLTTEMKEDLASRGEPSKLNERKVGDILTSLGLTSRSRTNSGYVLWLERSDHVRIHEMAREYEVDGTNSNQNCDLCKKTSAALTTSSTPEAAEEKQARSDKTKREPRERREHREGGPAAATRTTNRRATRSRSRRS